MVGQLRDLPELRTAERIDGLLRLSSLHWDPPCSDLMRQKILLWITNGALFLLLWSSRSQHLHDVYRSL
jgi:hypothetical protein